MLRLATMLCDLEWEELNGALSSQTLHFRALSPEHEADGLRLHVYTSARLKAQPLSHDVQSHRDVSFRRHGL